MKRIKYATNAQIIEHIKRQVSIDVTPYVDERSSKRALVIDTRKIDGNQLRQIAGICNGSVFLREMNGEVTLAATNKWLSVAPYGTWGHIFWAAAK